MKTAGIIIVAVGFSAMLIFKAVSFCMDRWIGKAIEINH